MTSEVMPEPDQRVQQNTDPLAVFGEELVTETENPNLSKLTCSAVGAVADGSDSDDLIDRGGKIMAENPEDVINLN